MSINVNGSGWVQKILKDQRGVGVIEVILIVVIVAVVGFVGWRLLETKKETDATNQTATQTSVNAVQQEDKNKGYVAIKDWGVRFKPSEGLKDVTYYKVTAKNGSKVLSENPGAEEYAFSTKAIEAIGGTCAPASDTFNPPVSITRVTKAISPAPEISVKVGDYYYYVTNSGSTCGDAAQSELQLADSKMLRESLKSLELAQ